ncbi:hypothetical protein ACFO1B_17865 [Dactylosporangium siamense]|uniref:Uncharacterized protein n=1 Tax=Dactylosporangium siamense TaxID=685454 RepID=A0A919PKA6_9ACTN|nr:hypothetical protein [Dactylosporangium siamense]GIG45712.1 hypothetical protein Dsi01nite_037530 [Dactylosporangium siamense]
MRGRNWQPTERTGGPIDEVFDNLRQNIPHLLIERLDVTHPSDDDNVYFLGVSPRPDLVQIDTAPHGQPPFIIEADQRIVTDDPLHAATTTRAWLDQLTA